MDEPGASNLGSAPFGVQRAIAVGLVAGLAAVSWLPHLPNSLWLDETLSYWVIEDGLSRALARGVEYQSHPAYYALLWGWTRLAGTSEIALRLPSLFAAVGACVLTARLGTKLTGDREVGLLAMVVLASTTQVFRESVDARPYMLGLCVLLALATLLIRWLERGRASDALGVGVLGAVLPHFHLFFALACPALIAYAVLRRGALRGRGGQIVLIGAMLALGALLWIPAGASLVANGGSYSFAPPPRWAGLFGMFVWTPAVAGLLAGLCIAGTLRWSQPDADGRGAGASSSLPSLPTLSRDAAVLLALWVLVPLLSLFAVSMATERSVFLQRYLIAAIPAVAILYALALRAIAAWPARTLAMIVIVLACFVSYARPHDDFRGAARAVNEIVAGDDSVPVLLATGLIESQHERWLRDPEATDYLQGPTAYYPLQGRVVTLPRVIPGQPIAREILAPVLRRDGRFVVIEWTVNGARVLAGVTQRAEEAGYRGSMKPGFGGVRVAVFEYVGRAQAD